MIYVGPLVGVSLISLKLVTVEYIRVDTPLALLTVEWLQLLVLCRYYLMPVVPSL